MIEGWEAGLGTHLSDLSGLRVVVIDDFAGADGLNEFLQFRRRHRQLLFVALAGYLLVR